MKNPDTVRDIVREGREWLARVPEERRNVVLADRRVDLAIDIMEATSTNPVDLETPTVHSVQAGLDNVEKFIGSADKNPVPKIRRDSQDHVDQVQKLLVEAQVLGGEKAIEQSQLGGTELTKDEGRALALAIDAMNERSEIAFVEGMLMLRNRVVAELHSEGDAFIERASKVFEQRAATPEDLEELRRLKNGVSKVSQKASTTEHNTRIALGAYDDTPTRGPVADAVKAFRESETIVDAEEIQVGWESLMSRMMTAIELSRWE